MKVGGWCLECTTLFNLCTFKQCVNLRRRFGPAQASDVIYNFGHPVCGDLIEISSSSCNLSLFSLKVGSHHDGVRELC